ncbi:hypothetical protein ACH4SP_23000 [Streptomyces sp. NPDC021093]|uniref:hypothetical protein n=1 Tax=Streptomyces sp. NPDC021093 TaxID=3365112 RepID=UPI0037890A73
MDGSGEQAAGEVDVREDEVGGVDSAEGGHTDGSVGRSGDEGLVEDSSVGEYGRSGLGRDGQRVLEDGVREVNGGMTELKVRRRNPARPAAQEKACGDEGVVTEGGRAEPGFVGEERQVESGVVGERRVIETGVAGFSSKRAWCALRDQAGETG